MKKKWPHLFPLNRPRRFLKLCPFSQKDCAILRHNNRPSLPAEDTTYLMNITDKILLALTFDLTEKYSASKGQHC